MNADIVDVAFGQTTLVVQWASILPEKRRMLVQVPSGTIDFFKVAFKHHFNDDINVLHSQAESDTNPLIPDGGCAWFLTAGANFPLVGSWLHAPMFSAIGANIKETLISLCLGFARHSTSSVANV